MGTRCAWVLLACLAGVGARADTRATTISAAIGISNLTKAQEQSFEQLACRPHRVGMYAAQGTGYALGNDFRLTSVNVRCRPHRYIENQPVAYVSYCRRDELDNWDCGRAMEKVFALINGMTFSVGANYKAPAVDEAYRVFRFLIETGQLSAVSQDKPFDYRGDREVSFAVWKDKGDKIYAHCDRYMVLTRLAPGEYRLEP